MPEKGPLNERVLNERVWHILDFFYVPSGFLKEEALETIRAGFSEAGCPFCCLTSDVFSLKISHDWCNTVSSFLDLTTGFRSMECFSLYFSFQIIALGFDLVIMQPDWFLLLIVWLVYMNFHDVWDSLSRQLLVFCNQWCDILKKIDNRFLN